MRKLLYLIAGLVLLPGLAAAQSSDPELILVEIVDFSVDAPAAFTGDEPIAITHAGDDRLFITTQQGRIWILDGAGSLLATPFLDIDPLVSCCGERGLLSVAFHPDYPTTPYFFVNYTNNSGNTVLARYAVSANPNVANAASANVLLTINQDSSNHNGGQLQFGPDDYLYVGMGDGGGGDDPNCRAQEEDTLLGKMLRLDIDVSTSPFYEPAPGNPFGGDFPMSHVWSKGLRNPWRFSFDRLTGDLYIGDVGQNQREEIDVIPFPDSGGQNFGWVRMEGTRCNDSSFPATCNTVVVPACDDPSFTDPIPELEYTHNDGCSVTGGYVYRGDRISPLQGWYIYGDYCSGTIWAAANDGGWVANVLTSVNGFNLSTFGEDIDGELYAGLLNGTVFRFDTTNADFIFADGFEDP